jgi:hypothetical protein
LGPAFGREQQAAPDWPWQSTDVPAVDARKEGIKKTRFQRNAKHAAKTLSNRPHVLRILNL